MGDVGARLPATFAVAENVVGFDFKTLLGILGKDGLYDGMEFNFSPRQLGIPSSRMRKYMFFYLRKHFKLSIDSVSFRPTFSEAFFRCCTVDASIYLIATPEEVKMYKNRSLKETLFPKPWQCPH